VGGTGSDSLSQITKMGTADMTVPDCAQIVPVKVKYYQMFPNRTKNTWKIRMNIKSLKILKNWIIT